MDITKIKKEKYEKKDYIKIYFKEPDTSSLKNLLLSLYNNQGYAKRTYYDDSMTKVQCLGSRRSFEDLLFICNTYIPDVSETDLMKALIKIRIKIYKCSGIRKIVFHFNASDYISEESFNKRNTGNFTQGTYTGTELIEILNNIS